MLAAADGARFEAYLHGAHVTSWRPAGRGDERLFLSPAVAVRGRAPRSAAACPVCFPQFADQGPLPMHGFARTTAVGRSSRRNARRTAPRMRGFASSIRRPRARVWPHAFACELAVTAKGPTLAIELAVTNTGADPFSFTDRLAHLPAHGRRAARCACAASRTRTTATRCESWTTSSRTAPSSRSTVRSIASTTPCRVDLEAAEPQRALSIRASGSTDTVVWNPGPGTGTHADLAPDAWRSFLCIEAAVASTKIDAVALRRPGAAPRPLTARRQEQRCRDRGRGTARRRARGQGAVAPLGPLPVRAAVGHRARGLQRRRHRLGILPARPRALARLPLGRGRHRRHLRRPRSSSASRSRCGTAPIRSSRSGCSA